MCREDRRSFRNPGQSATFHAIVRTHGYMAESATRASTAQRKSEVLTSTGAGATP